MYNWRAVQLFKDSVPSPDFTVNLKLLFKKSVKHKIKKTKTNRKHHKSSENKKNLYEDIR